MIQLSLIPDLVPKTYLNLPEPRKLTYKQVSEIEQYLNSGLPQKAIARLYGVSQARISQIKKAIIL